MEIYDISELKKGLDIGEYGDEITNYNPDDSIDNVFDEISRENVDMYNEDLYNFITKEPEWVEAAIDEFGWNGVGGDLAQAAAWGESFKIADDLSNNQDDIIQYYALSELENKNITEIDSETYSDFTKGLEKFDDNSRLGDIDNYVDDFAKEHNLLPSVDERCDDAASREGVNDGLESKEMDDPER